MVTFTSRIVLAVANVAVRPTRSIIARSVRQEGFKMPLTIQQQAVCDAVREGGAHINVSAVAGSGKTSTAVAATAFAGSRSAAMLAFNKHIAEELKRRMVRGVHASTLHSLGLDACRRGGLKGEVVEKKWELLLYGLRPYWFGPRRDGGKRPLAQAQAALDLSDMARITLTDERDPKALTALAQRYGIELPNNAEDILEATRELVAAGVEDSRIDYTDMLFLPLRLDLPVKKFELLFVDEAQDLSAAQRALALRAASGQVVILGDSMQAINGFAGADPESIPRSVAELSATRRGCVDRPLTVTFRCPISHVELAKSIVPHIEAAPGAIAGTITMVAAEDVIGQCTPGTMVLSRRTAPLVITAFRLLSAGIPASVRGRELGKGIASLVDRATTGNKAALGIPGLLEWLSDWHEVERIKLERTNAPESDFQSLDDRTACLRELAAGSRCIEELKRVIAKLFSTDAIEGGVLLSSIHRAKGLEAERVVVIDTESIPLVLMCRVCQGKGCEKCGGRGTRTQPWEAQQERNLAYVAVTRSRKELVFAGRIPALLGGW